ncbi:MAG: adenosylmethionine--8-amino-7-oxononanoate transaminase [Candidatus Berkiellales bacterium]
MSNVNNATLWLPYAQMQTISPPFEVIKSQGSCLTLADGRQLIDAVASWWTACHGYNHSHIISAIQQQASILPHVMLGGFIHPQAQKLATRLADLLPQDLSHIFYSESGSVAVEIAMKMALQFWINQNEKQRQQFICFKHGYHGDTFYAMSVCDPEEGMHRLFHPVLPQQYFHELPNNDDLLAAFEKWLAEYAHTVAGMLIEPLVQGAGGMKMHSPDTLYALCTLAKRYGIIVIFDEIFTGFGRTGSLFALEQAEVIPDILCLSKALTGGTLPLAVTIANRHIYDGFLSSDPEKAFMHGTTFMGNALACAAANASLDLFEQEPRLTQVAAIEKILLQKLLPLKDVPGVKDVRVKGAIGAVQLARSVTQDLNWFKQQFVNEGIWCRPFGDIVYTTPAFTIEPDVLIKITTAIQNQVKLWSQQYYRKE